MVAVVGCFATVVLAWLAVLGGPAAAHEASAQHAVDFEDLSMRELIEKASTLISADDLDDLLDTDSPRQALIALVSRTLGTPADSRTDSTVAEALAAAGAQEETALPHATNVLAETTAAKYWLRCSRADNYTGCLADRSVLGDSDSVSKEQAQTMKTRDILARLHRHEFFLMPWPRTVEWEHKQYQHMLREPATKRGQARRSYSERWYGSSLSGNNPLRIDEMRAIIAEGGADILPAATTPKAITALRGEKKQRPKAGELARPPVPWKELKKIWTLRLARELLMAGESDEALELFESLCSGKKSIRLFPNKCTDRRADTMADQMLRDFLALTWIRLGEQENCVADHTHESCLAPISGAGVHRRQRGAMGAIGVLNSTLSIVPQDLSSQYLMNIAHQQLGAPGPSTLAIDPRLIYSDNLYSNNAERYADFPRFLNVASPLKLDTVSLAGGVVVDDLNNDGLLDIVSSGDGLNDQLRVYINSGDGPFHEYTKRTDLQGESMSGVVGGINLCHTDYNNDGNIDVLVIRGGWKFGSLVAPNTLLQGHGDGSFTDVTAQAGLLFPSVIMQQSEVNLNNLRHQSSHSATWADYDLDGWVDLFVTAERDHWVGNQKCQLFHNNRDGTFSEVADPVMRECGWQGNPKSKDGSLSKGSTWGDVNGDGWPDLYISHLNGPNSLFLNKGKPKDLGSPAGLVSGWEFEEVGKQSGSAIPYGTFATWMFDFNNDGNLDIFAAGYGGDDDALEEVARTFLGTGDQRPTNHEWLLRNNGDGTFTDATIQTGLGYTSGTMGANFGDLDNDGWLDAYMGTGNPDMRTLQPNVMVRNVGGSHFEDVTYSGGFGHLQKGHGIAFADLDNDGDQEVVANMGAFFSGDFFKSAIFFNPIRNHSEVVPVQSHHYIKIKLVGRQSNRAAIGARVAVTVRSPTEARGSWFGFGSGSTDIRTIYAVVSEGGSYGSNPLQLHVGLGNAVTIEKIEVIWPVRERTVQTFVPNGELQPPLELNLDSTIAITEGEPWPILLDSPNQRLRFRNDIQHLVDDMVANPTGSVCSMHDDGE